MDDNEYIILRRSPAAGIGELDLDVLEATNSLWRADALGTTSRKKKAGRRKAAKTEIELHTESMSEHQATDLSRDPDVLATAISIPISLVRPMAAPADEDTQVMEDARTNHTSWGVQEVAPRADASAGASTTVAVLDTGIDPTHPAFAGVNLTRKNFSSSANEDDVLGHGTHCAGTIFGRDVEGVRIGMARGVRNALIGKILNDEGAGNTGAVARAMQWASDQGAHVISMSLGIEFGNLVTWLEKQGKPRAEALSRALSAFRDSVRLFDATIQALNAQSVMRQSGAIVVAAAGNESSRDIANPAIVDLSLPAAALGVISVGAVSKRAGNYEIAPFSNANPMVAAPGVGIVSAHNGGGLVVMDGTSMAAPHVAGAAVLWRERVARDNPSAGAEFVKAKLLVNCRTTNFAASVKARDRGAGLVMGPDD